MLWLLVVLTAVEIAAVVAALTVYLIAILRSLRGTVDSLANVNFGVRAIETQLEPVGPTVARLNQELEDLGSTLTSLGQAESTGAAGRE